MKKKDVDKLYGLDGDWDELLLTAYNQTSSDVFFNFFDPLIVQQVEVPTTPSSGFYISSSNSSDNYNQAVRDFLYNPCWTRRMYVYSKTEQNLNQVINHIYKDANGIECQIPRFPSLSVGINQFQGWIGELDFPNKETVFGINQWFKNVLIKANSEIGFLLIYKQIDKSNMLSVSNNCDYCPAELRKWNEDDLLLNDYSLVSEFKQNMYEGETQPAVKPFDFSVLKEWQGK